MNGLFWRALLAFLVFPGMVAFVIPIGWVRPTGPGHTFDMVALIPLTLGIIGLLWCVRDFYVAGKGTLAPWSPPRELVVGGLYRYSRNPMYLAVLVILWGWALAFHSPSLVRYALAVTAFFYVRVVVFEEPWLARTHGDAWTRYKARVPRWIWIRRS